MSKIQTIIPLVLYFWFIYKYVSFTSTLSSQFHKCSMGMGQSQLTVQKVQLEIKMIKSLKTPVQAIPA